jgi:hypothetical protein
LTAVVNSTFGGRGNISEPLFLFTDRQHRKPNHTTRNTNTKTGGAVAGAFIGFRSGSVPMMAATAAGCSLLCVAIHLKCVRAWSIWVVNGSIGVV